MKKLLTISGVVLGSAVGATAAYFFSPKDGKSYQREIKTITLKAEKRVLEVGIEVLDQWIDFLESSNDGTDDNEVISFVIKPKNKH